MIPPKLFYNRKLLLCRIYNIMYYARIQPHREPIQIKLKVGFITFEFDKMLSSNIFTEQVQSRAVPLFLSELIILPVKIL